MHILFILIFTVFYGFVNGQSRNRNNWVDFGSSHVNKWLQIAPAKMGPNSLPVPEMDYGLVDSLSNFKSGVHAHFMDGDKAANSYLSFYWCVVPQKVAVQIWGNPTETFQMDNRVRDERQVFYDDTGWITNAGDLWISTFVQLLKGHEKWPDIGVNYSLKSTTGNAKHARYTDTPAQYYYIVFGKSHYPKSGFFDELRFAAIGGFYYWQTNKVEMAQDEGPLYQLAVKMKRKKLLWANEIGGFHGYDVYGFIGAKGYNDPLVYRTGLTRRGNLFSMKWEYQTGLNDYHYNTLRMSVTYRF